MSTLQVLATDGRYTALQAVTTLNYARCYWIEGLKSMGCVWSSCLMVDPGSRA